MIFAVATEEQSLSVFADEADAIAHCESLDVEAAIWLFRAEDGSPLEPEFVVPNKRGLFSVKNGTYRLVSASPKHHAELGEALDDIVQLQPNEFFNSLAEIRQRFATVGTSRGGT